MFKNLKLGTKIISGFVLVLILTGVVGICGYMGLNSVTVIVDKADDGNRLIKQALECRQQEKNFMLRKDKKYQEENNATMQAIHAQIDATMAKLKDTKDKALLSQVDQAAQAYKANFDAWVALSDKQQGQEEAMVQNARTFIHQSQALQDGQNEKAAVARTMLNNIAGYNRAHMEWAAGVHEFLMNKDLKTLAVQKDGTQCSFGKWLASPEFAAQVKIAGSAVESIVDRMRKDHIALHASAVEVEKGRQMGQDRSLEVYNAMTAPVLEKILSMFKELEAEANRVYAVKMKNAGMANYLITQAQDCRQQEKNFMLRGDKTYQKQNDPTMATICTECDNLKAALKVQSDKDMVDKVKMAARQYKEGFDAWVDLWDQQQEKAAAMVENAREFTKLCEDFRAGQKAKMQGTNARSVTMMVAAALLAIAIGGTLAVLITRSITKPVNRIIAGLNDGAEQVASASEQVSAASQSLAEGSSEQAASLEETSASLEEMASMTRQNAANAGQGDSLMKETTQIVNQANDAMGQLRVSMEEISTASEETYKIIKTIDEIAFQTNLLALNAAVEAARAGEAGAGFAVVADEVRNLAMRAADAAKNTSDLIEGTVRKVKDGADLTASTNDSFVQVAESAHKVADLVSEIAAASNEQAQGIEQVNKAVTEMDKVTQQNAANAEESASASEELNAQAEQMKVMVADLVDLVGGHQGKMSASRPAVHKSLRRVGASLTSAAGVGNRKGILSPEQMIPLTEEVQFSEF